MPVDSSAESAGNRLGRGTASTRIGLLLQHARGMVGAHTDRMGEKFSLQALAREQLELARRNRSGRSAKTVVGGHERLLRQTLLTMVADVSLAEHESPGEATLFVLSGRVRLTTSETSWEGITGDMPIIPPISHGLHAVEDSAVMLTVAKHP